MNKVTKESYDLILKLHLKGVKYKDISEQTGLSFPTIKKYLKNGLPNTKRVFSEQQESTLLSMYNSKHSLEDISKAIGCHSSTIIRFMRQHYPNIKKDRVPSSYIHQPLVTKEVGEKIVELYKIHWSMEIVSEIINIGRASILRYLNKYHKDLIADGKKYRIRKATTRTYTLNESYFNFIDTTSKAYILGFLYADGYNNEKSGTLQVALQKRDVLILEQIKKEIESTCTIEEKENYCRLTINSRLLSNDLRKWGCHQAKSFTLKFPDFLREDLYSHFIRGYFDGDGCVQTMKSCRTTIISYVGNVQFLNDLNTYLSATLDIKAGGIRTYKKCQDRIGELRFGKKEVVRKIKDFMYNDSTLYLERKFNKFKMYDL